MAKKPFRQNDMHKQVLGHNLLRRSCKPFQKYIVLFGIFLEIKGVVLIITVLQFYWFKYYLSVQKEPWVVTGGRLFHKILLLHCGRQGNMSQKNFKHSILYITRLVTHLHKDVSVFSENNLGQCKAIVNCRIFLH